MRNILALLVSITLIINLTPPMLYAAAPTQSSEVSTTTKSSDETLALRAQVEIMRHYDQRLLATVYWSLGVLATITILLIGFGWFANFHLYERDKIALKQELKAFLKEELSEIKTTLVSDTQKKYENILAEARSTGSSYSAAVRKELLSKIESINYDLKTINCDLIQKEAKSWEEQRVLTNAFGRYSELLGYALELNNEYLISSALDDIQRVVKKIADDPMQRKPEALEIGQLLDRLAKLPREHTIMANGIKKLLETIKST